MPYSDGKVRDRSCTLTLLRCLPWGVVSSVSSDPSVTLSPSHPSQSRVEVTNGRVTGIVKSGRTPVSGSKQVRVSVDSPTSLYVYVSRDGPSRGRATGDDPGPKSDSRSQESPHPDPLTRPSCTSSPEGPDSVSRPYTGQVPC